VIIDKPIAQTLAGHFIPDQLAALHLSDGREKRADFLNLSHGLREIVYDQVGFSVVFYQIWTCHAVLHHLVLCRKLFEGEEFEYFYFLG